MRIPVYDEMDGFEEKTRSAGGFPAAYQGFHTRIRWSETEKAYYGRIEGIPDLVTYNQPAGDYQGKALQYRVIHAFVRAVAAYAMEHPEATRQE